ncbi:hypothetical protein MSG28_003658 [Choristoneura fumiferana]|uniref:Uncharacterized protein n=1 Tax=Choristoneura fumiferana TaxID=7141 RepID=A0ACC0KFR7_CHOFU|nr:hypothetical protein MSG28_003658 [Choristoneura fumiferana]
MDLGLAFVLLCTSSVFRLGADVRQEHISIRRRLALLQFLVKVFPIMNKVNDDISLSESSAMTRSGCNLNGISGTPTLLLQLPHKARGGERRCAAGARVSPAPARGRTRRLRSLATVKVPAPDIHCSTTKFRKEAAETKT